jgi:hypothetical protein
MPSNGAITSPIYWIKVVSGLLVVLQLSLAPAVLSAPDDTIDDAWQAALAHPEFLIEKQTNAQLTFSTEWSSAQLREHLETTLADRGWTLVETDSARMLRSEGRLNNLPFVADFIKANARLHCFLEVLEGERVLTITWSQLKRS